MDQGDPCGSSLQSVLKLSEYQGQTVNPCASAEDKRGLDGWREDRESSEATRWSPTHYSTYSLSLTVNLFSFWLQCPDARMHLSLDTMSMVDDSCLSPSNFHEMVKGGGIAAGGRVHSIDVILGFSKDQDPLLSPAGAPRPHKADIDGLVEPGKQQEPSSHSTYSGHLSSLRNGSTEQQEQQYHGEYSWGCWRCSSPS